MTRPVADGSCAQDSLGPVAGDSAMAAGETVTTTDRRIMAAAVRFSRWHVGLTGSNPSVATLIVKDEGHGPVIIGRGLTAPGGRPHAEAQALRQAGVRARGATAYVTLEPCAHHGRTPPCANALVEAGVVRVVSAATDPDERVSGRGYAILRAAGLALASGVMAKESEASLAGYMMQRTRHRAHVTLKLAVSADGRIGRRGHGQVAISGPVSRAQAHLMRAESDAVLIGIATALEDDPQLTCRLPGLERRSPVRIVLDTHLRLPLSSSLVASARTVPLMLATTVPPDDARRLALEEAGVGFIAAAPLAGHMALPELLEDLAARGIYSVLVEGGATLARAFLDDGLVDRIALFTAARRIDATGSDCVDAPFTRQSVPAGFVPVRQMHFGADLFEEFERG